MSVPAHAVLVLALWRETNGAWWVRVTRSTPRAESGHQPTYAATRADVLRAVEDWFDQAVTPP